MKYWAIHIILVGLLAAIWIPTFASKKEAMNVSAERKSAESYSIDPNDRMQPAPPRPGDEEEFVGPPETRALDDDSYSRRRTEPAASGTPQDESLIRSFMGSMKELASTVVVFGNAITFFWQWRDRRKKKKKKKGRINKPENTI